ncbi:MAG: bifunctional DNA-formamidopyrimidine glycosylase/DNA-(apurinic or apyrimidinic site) lyase [Armatimonadota bacterium]|jgi:formamidopyrimidine-DNA glycosylase
MPELPEVETIRRQVADRAVGLRLVRVRVLHRGMLQPHSPRAVTRALRGRRLTAAERRGKLLVLAFDHWALLVHFRMSGTILAVPPEAPVPRHARTMFDFAGPRRSTRRLVLSDVRTLGTIELCRADAVAGSRSMRNIGRDALSDGMDGAALHGMLAGRTRPIKPFLLDQRYVAGLGNIYAAEALHRARLSPLRACAEVSRAEAGRLYRSIAAVLERAVEANGTTFSGFRTVDGDSGRFARLLRVYGREGERCRRRGCRGRIVRVKQCGRSTFYCPACQI